MRKTKVYNITLKKIGDNYTEFIGSCEVYEVSKKKAFEKVKRLTENGRSVGLINPGDIDRYNVKEIKRNKYKEWLLGRPDYNHSSKHCDRCQEKQVFFDVIVCKKCSAELEVLFYEHEDRSKNRTSVLLLSISSMATSLVVPLFGLLI